VSRVNIRDHAIVIMGGKTMAQKLLSAASSPSKIWRERAMTGRSDIYTFMDCPHRGIEDLFGSADCMFDRPRMCWVCETMCSYGHCPKGYRV
jgi:hypothetical protein